MITAFGSQYPGPWAAAVVNGNFTGSVFYRLGQAGVVQFSGSLTGVTGGLVVAFNLPAAYRPSAATRVAAAMLLSGTACFVSLAPNGDVSALVGIGAAARLDGVEFVIANGV